MTGAEKLRRSEGMGSWAMSLKTQVCSASTSSSSTVSDVFPSNVMGRDWPCLFSRPKANGICRGGFCTGGCCSFSTPTGMQRDRKSVVLGKSVSVRVDLGGSRLLKKKKKEKINN